MTNLGPLTTTFTPQGPDCASTFLGRGSNDEWVQYGVGGSPSSACYPSSFDPHQSFYYSPGICPSGYTAACTAEISVSGNAAAQQLTCCPESYSCHPNRGTDPFACISVLDGTKTFSVSTYSFEKDENNSTTKIDIGTTTAVYFNIYLLAYGPLVIPPGGDDTSTTGSITSTSASGSAATSSAASATPGTSIASTPTQSNTPSTTPHESTNGSSGLSRGAVAGISVGSVLAAVLLVGVVAFLIARRRKRSKNPSTAIVGSEVTSPFKTQQYLDQQYQQDQQHQQYQQNQQYPYELSEERQIEPYELGGERA
ncbi:hypothetical protein F4678DRAFT_459943 [Xylaria arbuscula]|nr:hypothetical protein F4678DRAFT_459943 [Xylaria arbuscula]